MSLSKPILSFVKSEAISLDINKANNNKGELWGAVTSVSTDPMSTTDNYIKDTSLEVFKIIHPSFKALEHSLLQLKSQHVFPVLEEHLDSHHGATNIGPTNKKTINRVLVRFHSHSPSNKTSVTTKLSFVTESKGLVSKKNLVSYSQVLSGNRSDPGVYDPDNPALYQVQSEDRLIVIHKKESKLQDCLLKKINIISFLDIGAKYSLLYTKLLKKIGNSRFTSPQLRQFNVVDDLYYASVIPSLVYKPWDIGEPNHKSILPITHSISSDIYYALARSLRLR